jgi:hypothetical protein
MMRDMPTWVAIVVAVASGLLSGLVGTVLTIRHGRRAAIHARALPAVEEFAVASGEWFARIGRAVRARYDDEEQADELIADAMSLIGNARGAVNRIAILLGPEASVSREAALVVEGLNDALELVDAWPPEFSDGDKEYLAEQPDESRNSARADLTLEYIGEALNEARFHLFAARGSLDRFASAVSLTFDPPWSIRPRAAWHRALQPLRTLRDLPARRRRIARTNAITEQLRRTLDKVEAEQDRASQPEDTAARRRP